MSYEQPLWPSLSPTFIEQCAPRPPALPGLPEAWPMLSLDEQTAYLRNNHLFLRALTYTTAGLAVGSRRLDQGQQATEHSTSHLDALQQSVQDPAAAVAFAEGNTSFMEEPRWPLDTSVKKLVFKSVQDYFGSELNNPRAVYDIYGYNYGTGRTIAPSNKLISESVFNAMETEEWPVELLALAGLQLMHQSASRRAKLLVKPLLDPDKLPRLGAGQGQRFWDAKVSGVPNIPGVAYQLGYRAKSGPVLRDAMEDQWGADCQRNRDVFTTALNLNISNLSDYERHKVQRTVRRPVFRLIMEGCFQDAFTQLQSAGREQAELFSPVSRSILGI